MKLANVNDRAAIVIGGGAGDTAVDIESASAGAYGPTMADVYAKWDAFVAWAATASLPAGTPFTEAELGAISPTATQVFAIGLNYRAHAAEGGSEVPKAPATFTKFQSCLGRPFADVATVPGAHDWEAELVVVMARHTHKVAAADAWSYVAGVTVGQDYSERITQKAAGAHFSLGKSFPGFGPTGPWLVTPDELPNKDDLAISCEVSGQMMQSSRTSNMVFPVEVLIEYISGILPLNAGDIIFTGTPEGVGYPRTPPRLLGVGDVVTTTIEGIGSIRQNIV
jgi:2,4-didehydro-3-deoxy-L-rhamnonate hydrolase